MISVEELLSPLPGEAPCGEDLSYDPALSDLETRLQGRPETQFAVAEEPNWREVHELCLRLFQRTKDLRVAIALALTLLSTEGLPGFAQGMELLRGLLERYWPTFYPHLDPADDNDPLERVNLLASVAAPEGTFGDPLRFVSRLRQVPLCRSAVAGGFSLAQLTHAAAAASGGGDTATAGAPNPAVIQGAFRDTPAEVTEALSQAAARGLAAVQAIDAFVTTAVGAGNQPNFDTLATVLREIQAKLRLYAPTLAAAPAAAATAGTANPLPEASAASVPGSIRSREDVVRMLDAICAFYFDHEPSSPVPSILTQARGLVGRNFLDILQLLTPDAIPQVKLTAPEPPAE